MDLKERIQNLCKQNGVSMNKVETDLGFGKGYISKLGKSIPNATKIKQIAEYFHVSVDYLMSGEEALELNDSTFTAKDERDIAKDLERIMGKLSSGEDGPASFEGTDIPAEDQELFAGQIELMLRRLKAINKEKYNPNKNKK
jgi:transcriptional regulator with XRE-family HTH domain